MRHPASFDAAIALPKGIEDATERVSQILASATGRPSSASQRWGESWGTLLLSRDDGLSGGLNARAIRVDRALAAQHDPALRLLSRAEILRQVRAVFEPRPLGPGAVSREFRDQHMVGLGEDNGRRLDRCARPRPQIAAARWRPAEHEREGVDLIEDHDAAATAAAVREQRGGFHKRLDIFG